MSKVSRRIIKAIKVYANKYPSLALTGPRQSGKTTLLRSQFADYRYVGLKIQITENMPEKTPMDF